MFKRLLLVLVSVMAFQTSAHSATFTFGWPIDLRSGEPAAIAVADFNGDGRDDLAAVVQGQLKVSLQGADGALAPALSLGAGFRTVRSADLGADGTREILVGLDKGLAVYKWDGAGAFVLNNHPGSYACFIIATADLDGDGAPDVVCTGREADATLYYSDAATVLGAPSYLQTAAMNAGGAELKDVTGDGKPDLLLASSFANSFFVYRHDGDRGFLPAVAYPYPEEAYLWSFAVDALDLGDDGANEVVVAAPCNMPCATLYIHRQGANGYLELSERIPTLDSPEGFLVADVDADGREDLLVGHGGWHTVSRYLGRGQGLSSPGLWSSVAFGGNSRQLAVGDLNHDGHLDLAVANTFGVSLLYGGLQVASDFDADFVSDLYWRSQTGENVRWKSADSTNALSLSALDPSWSAQATGDFDGDGLADLFWRNRTTGANQIWSNGASMIEETASVPSQDWQVVGAGDFDGDGRADLVWRNGRTGANAIWKSGKSATPQATASVTDQRWKVAGVGDLDGDGRSDVLWRHSSSGSNAIWRSGRHDLPQAMTAVPNQQWTVAGIGDFNGDRKDDLVWRNTSTGANAIWLSANSATQQAVSAVPARWIIAAVGDYNGDGRADLMWRNSSTGANVIWRSADSRQTQAVTTISGWNVVR